MQIERLKFNELHLAPARPGLYAWYAAPNPGASLQDYHGIYKSRTLNAFISGNLKEQYEGTLYAKALSYPSSEDRALLEAAAEAFSPPLYIGVSSDLRNRLSTHSEMLKDAMYTAELSESPNEQVQSDTNEESASFAARMSLYARDTSLGVTAFHVRMIVLPEGYARHKLLSVETFLNRTYTPHYGLR